MNTVQENLFRLLTEIDGICKKYGIKYFLAGGTALGTVRNHCFLPWDDDIDLYITRDNWNKLRHIIETEENVFPEGHNENTKYYCNPIPRYVDNTTTAIYKSQALAGKACGQHIEFLIMDPMPNGEEERQEYIDLLRVYTELLSPYFVVNKNLSLDDWQKHYKLYKEYCDRVDKEGEEKVIKELEDKLQHFSTEECDTFCMRWGIDILMYKKEYYGNGRLERFETGEFPVAERAEGIFRVAYGDSWMYIPEYEEQVVHNALQDISIPFHEYTMKQAIEEGFILDVLKNYTPYSSYYRVLKAVEDDPESEEFNDYRELQLNKSVRKYQIIVPISDKNIATLLLNSIEQGKYYEANKYLNIRKIQEKPLSDALIEIEKTMNLCKELSIARYDKKDEELVQNLINENENRYPNLLDIYRAKLWIKENNAKSIEDYKEIENLCEEVLELYPFDGETMASYAKAKLECDKKEEAIEIYKKAIFNTRNGLIWQKVEDEIGISRIDIERDLIEELEDEN